MLMPINHFSFHSLSNGSEAITGIKLSNIFLKFTLCIFRILLSYLQAANLYTIIKTHDSFKEISAYWFEALGTMKHQPNFMNALSCI